MKKVHYFVYGLLAGAVLVLSSVVLVQSVDTNKARAQGGASSSSDVAMVTGQYQQSEHILYVVANNPKGEPVLMSYAMPAIGNFGLIAARSLKYDRRMKDIAFGRPQGRSNKTSPPYTRVKRAYDQQQKNEEGRQRSGN